MTTARFALPRPRRTLINVALAATLALGSCGRFIEIDETSFGTLEIAPVLACTEEPLEERRLLGVHLRQTDVTQPFEMLSMTGAKRESRLPRTLRIDEKKARLIATTDQEPGETRRATAAPRRAFSNGESLPAVYDLAYALDGEDHAGPLVAGNSATGFDLPGTGRKVYRGRVQLSQTVFGADGTALVSTADAQFAAVVGYGSKVASFTLSDVASTSGTPMPFVSLQWRNLGLCGTRVVSTGQGTVRLLSEKGLRTSPFIEGRRLPILLSSFEAMHFESLNAPDPLSAFGGIFAIEGDAGTLSAVFLSQTSR